MALLIFNLSGVAVTLAAGNPPLVIPASGAPAYPGPGVDGTAELRGLAAGDYVLLEAQRIAIPLTYDWTDDSDYDTGALTISPPTGGTATEATLVTIKNSVANIPAKGTATMVGSTPVTIASDDTLTLAIKNSVAAIPAKGTAATAGSTPVTLASDDVISLAIKNSVAAIPAKGTAAMVGATPVTLASDDQVSLAFAAHDAVPPTNVAANIGQDIAPVAVTSGHSVRAWFTTLGAQVHRLVDVAGGPIFPPAVIPADGDANIGASATITRIASRLWSFNGTTWDMIRSGLTGIQTTVVGVLNTLPIGRYNSTQPTLADTNAVTLQVDSRGNLRVASMVAPQAQDDYNQVIATMMRPTVGTTYACTLYTYYAGAITKALILTGNRQAFTIFATNRNAAVRYLQLFNKATEPTAGALSAISLVFMIPALGSIAVGHALFTNAGVNFPLGLGWTISTTPGSFTDAATASEHEVIVSYI